nr:integration host factor subunit alpha [Labilithrix luteola]
MTKAEIVQALYAKVGGFSKKESADIVDLVFEMMKETLGRGEKIKISGFGNFVLRDKRQRPGRNPQTGDPIKISERRVLTFKASQILKHALNPKSSGAPSSPTGASSPSAQASSPSAGGSSAPSASSALASSVSSVSSVTNGLGAPPLAPAPIAAAAIEAKE